MKAEVWQRVREILDQAIATDVSERSLYLDQACNGDSELRSEVESLLRSHDDAGSVFLKNPAADLKAAVATAAAPAHGRIGRRIGAYEIVEEIGHGGMGEVYRAVRADGQFTQQVAIKLVRAGMDAPTILERFRNERQILASLDNPNIARLYDGGTTPDGIPYLVMELIEGTPIDEYCAKSRLEIPARLSLFLQICSAVQYAHQRLVIHRDIKPGNILVTAQGVPKLLDFGIAKILDRAAGTETTLLRPMTPEYASPEQIRGESITTASDVYSLGVVFYRLLTGRSPYPEKTRSPLEFAKAICELEPERPSTVFVKALRVADDTSAATLRTAAKSVKRRRALAGDLDNIVLKALRKESDRRYASAEQMAEDIRRHLAGLTVTATPDSVTYRAGKFVRRHTLAMTATGLILVAIAGGVAATLREARIAAANQRRAEKRFDDVRRLANSLMFEIDDSIQDLPGATGARRLLIARSLEYLDSLSHESGGDLSLERELAAAYARLGDLQVYRNGVDETTGAIASYQKAFIAGNHLCFRSNKGE
jgi:serine/threonine protein kinase